jgi:exodeoxyribonuclease V beta subunit
MQNKFDVLSSEFDCLKSHFLQASAGTGKTFAIEHTVSKLLLSQKAIDISEILVVTFTKKAVDDLKIRIFDNLSFLHFHEKDHERAHLLKRALESFDLAPIYTIHSFCLNTLKEFAFDAKVALNVDFEGVEEGGFEKKLILDYLKFQILEDGFSSNQIKIILDMLIKPNENLIEKIRVGMQKGLKIKTQPNFNEIFEQFTSAVAGLKYAEEIYDDFIKFKGYFQKINNIKKQIKPEILEQLLEFQNTLISENVTFLDFDALILKRDPISSYLKDDIPSNSKALSEVFEKICPLIEMARDFNILFARVVEGCNKLKDQSLDKSISSFDDVLWMMQRSLKNYEFIKKVREKYKVVIIDEFQDTDPVQWDIFFKLFVENSSTICYLVGDPKQSIYAFRRADIYTYLKAKDCFKNASIATLSTNYRSSKPLVEALNTLFCSAPWMPLPKTCSFLEVEPLHAVKEPYEFIDQKAPLHFIINEGKSLKGMEQSFYPFIADEILNLKKQHFNFSDIAILVNDKNQSARISDYLKQRGIDTNSKKGNLLAKSKGFLSLLNLFNALQDLNDLKALNTCLIDPLFGYSLEDLKKNNPLDLLPPYEEGASIVKYLNALIYQASLKLIAIEGGIDLIREIRQTFELILEYINEFESVGAIRDFLKNFKNNQVFTQNNGLYLEGVNIITMHSSKGLEYEVVFLLGALARNLNEDWLIEEEGMLVPLNKKSRAYKHYMEEKDAEKARQFYVAMTRAKNRLYLPCAIADDVFGVKVGGLSPLEVFLKAQSALGKEFFGRLQKWQESAFITYEEVDSTKDESHFAYKQKSHKIYPSIEPDFKKRFEVINSYSSIVKTHITSKKEIKKDFPAGNEVGIILHEIFEKEAFTEDALKNAVRGTLLEDFFEEINSLVHLTLNAELKSQFATFTLKDIPPDKKAKEVEFLIDSQGDNGFLTGFIDLIFEHGDRFYILDYKSNALEDYTSKAIMQAMQENGYDVQESIYRDSLKKFLLKKDPRPFEECFGGSFYIFLRGLKTSGGIWYMP